MKKIFALVAILSLALFMSACNRGQSDFDIKIVIPAESKEEFVYSEEEIFSRKNTITVFSGEGLADTEVRLKTVGANEETEYAPVYLTRGMPAEIEVQKGVWFKIGVNMQNPTDEDIVVYVNVSDVDVRIE